MIIDAHMHLPVKDECTSFHQKKENLLYEMRMNNVRGGIVISDSCTESAIGSMDECVELFKEISNVSIVGGISPYFEFQAQFIKLEKYLCKKLLVGIKLFTGHEAFYLTDEKLKEIYQLAIQYNVPVLFHSGWDNSQYSDVKLVAEIANNYPKLKLIVCHCFYPELEKCMFLLDLENVFFDLSSIADNVSTRENSSSEIKKIINLVPQRVIFGSDFSCCSQKEHIEFVRKLKLAKSIEDNVFWRNAKSIFNLQYQTNS